MAPLPRVFNQLPGDRLITLGYFHNESNSILSFLGYTFTLHTDLSYMQAMLLPKLTPMVF